MCLSTGLWSVFGLDLRVPARRDTPSKTPEWPGCRCQAYRPPVIDWRGHLGTARAGWPGIWEDAMTILSDVAACSLLAFAALHDMAVVENVADRVAVMSLGQIVEMGTRAQVFGDPRHPYTQRLIEAVPVPDPAHVRAPLPRLAGDVPSPVHAVGQGPARLTLYDVGGGHLGAG